MENLPEIVEIPQIPNNNQNLLVVDEKKKQSKGPAIAIFVIIGILLVGYIIYMYEAYRNHFFPFPKFQFTPENMPPNSILALGTVRDEPIVDDDNKDELEAIIQGVLASNVAWYNTTKSAAVRLQYTPLGATT